MEKKIEYFSVTKSVTCQLKDNCSEGPGKAYTGGSSAFGDPWVQDFRDRQPCAVVELVLPIKTKPEQNSITFPRFQTHGLFLHPFSLRFL